MKHMLNNYFKRLLVSVLAFAGSLACECKRSLDDSSNDLVMTVSKSNLQGYDKTTDLIFSIANDDVVADLSKYVVDIGVKSDTEEDHLITYPDKDGVHIVDSKFFHDLAKLSKNVHLNADNKSFSIPLTLLPEGAAKNMKVVCHLKTNSEEDPRTVHTVFVTWEDEKTPETFTLIPTRTRLVGSENDLEVEISNETRVASDAGLKLSITRLSGTSAIIVGSTPVGTDQSELSVPIIASHAHCIQKLIIDPKYDVGASFQLQLRNNGQFIGKPLTISWQKCVSIQVQAFNCDPKTNKIYCSFENTTSSSLADVKLICDPEKFSQFENFKREHAVGNLAAGEIKEGIEIGTVKVIGNNSVPITYSFTWTENGITRKTPSTTYMLQLNKAFVDVDLRINYNAFSNQVYIDLKNEGHQLIDELRLEYENVSKNSSERFITLGGEPEGTILFTDVTSKEKIKKQFPLVLRGNQSAAFTFRLYHKGKMVLKKEEIFSGDTNLKLVILKPVKASTETATLYGPQEEIILKVENSSSEQLTDHQQLKLVIDKQADDPSIISVQKGGTAIQEIYGQDLLRQGQVIKLYLKPGANQKEVKFALKLFYEGREIVKPVNICWQEYNPYIECPNSRLVGDQIGEFNIYNSNGYMDLDKLSVYLTTAGGEERNVQFITLSGKGLPNGTKLGELLLPSPADAKLGIAKNVKFRIIDDGNNKQTKKKTSTESEIRLKLVVKRDGIALVEQALTWVPGDLAKNKTKEKSVEFRVNNYVIRDTDQLNITVKNSTSSNKEIDMGEIKPIITAALDAPVSFRLGNVSGNTIDNTLNVLTGVHSLDPQVEAILPFSLANRMRTKVAAGICIEFVDIKNNNRSLQKLYILCVNSRISIKGKEVENLVAQLVVTDIENIPYEELSQHIEQISKAIEYYDDLVQNIQNIIRVDAGFSHILVPVKGTYESDRRKWQGFLMKLQEARDKLKKQDKIAETIELWENKLAEQLKQAEEKINNASATIDKLEGVALIQLLIAPYKQEVEISSQSIKEIYKKLSQDLRVLEQYCSDVGNDTPRGGLPAIKKIMKKKLPIIKLEVDNIFERGLEKIKGDLEQQYKQFVISNVTNKKQLDAFYDQIEGTLRLFDACKSMSKNSNSKGDVGIDSDQWAEFTVKEFWNCTEHIVELNKAYKNMGQEGAAEKCVRLLLSIESKIIEIQKSNPSEAIKTFNQEIGIYTSQLAERSKSLTKGSNVFNVRQNSVVAIPTTVGRLKDSTEQNDLRKLAKRRTKELTRQSTKKLKK